MHFSLLICYLKKLLASSIRVNVLSGFYHSQTSSVLFLCALFSTLFFTSCDKQNEVDSKKQIVNQPADSNDEDGKFKFKIKFIEDKNKKHDHSYVLTYSGKPNNWMIYRLSSPHFSVCKLSLPKWRDDDTQRL